MNLLALLGLAMPARSTIVLVFSAALAGFISGYVVKGKFEAAARSAAVERAIVAERRAVEAGNQVEAEYLARLDQQKRTSDAKIRDLQKRLANVPGCPVPVPGEWLRGPDSVPAAPGPAARYKGASESLAPVADSRTVVEYCERARLEAFEPNVEQIRALQQWVEEQRRIINR